MAYQMKRLIILDPGTEIPKKGRPNPGQPQVPEQTAGTNAPANVKAALGTMSNGGSVEGTGASSFNGKAGGEAGTDSSSSSTGTKAPITIIIVDSESISQLDNARSEGPADSNNSREGQNKVEKGTSEITKDEADKEYPKGRKSSNAEEEAPKKSTSWDMSKYFSSSFLGFLGCMAFAAWSFDQLYNQALAYQAACNGCWMISDGNSVSDTSSAQPDKCKIAILTCNPTYRVPGTWDESGPTPDPGDSSGTAGYNVTTPDASPNPSSYPLCDTCYATQSANSSGLRIYHNPKDDIGMDTQVNGSTSTTYSPGNTDNGGCGNINFNGCPQSTQICGGGDMSESTGTDENPCVDMQYYPYPSPSAEPATVPPGTELCPNFFGYFKS